MADASVEAWAQREVSALTPVATPKGIREADIREKVAAGLSRPQAIEVLKAQQAHDERLEEEAEQAGKTAKQAAKRKGKNASGAESDADSKTEDNTPTEDAEK